MKLNIAIGQISTRLGSVQDNLEKHLALAKDASRTGAELIVFPELSLTGYVLQDMVPSVACHADPQDPIFKHLLAASRKIDMVVGFVEDDRRHRFYIASAYLSGGKVVHIHRKVYLPTYGMFDESRFYAPGTEVRAFDTRFGRLGILICEDFWHASPPYLLWLDGADILFFSSASPGRGLNESPKLASSTWVEQINRAYANLFTVFTVHVNRTGFEDGLNFWGGSTVFDPDGNLIFQAPYFEESLAYCQVDLNQLHRTRSRLPLLRDEHPELMEHELKRILHGN